MTIYQKIGVWARGEDLHSKQGIKMEQLFHLDLWSTKLIKVIANLLPLEGHFMGEVWAKQGQGGEKICLFKGYYHYFIWFKVTAQPLPKSTSWIKPDFQAI